MLNKKVVQKALKKTWKSFNNSGNKHGRPAASQSYIISQLIYDIFGGEILKTHKKKEWYFYNRINGKRIDFASLLTDKSSNADRPEDLVSSPEETHNYFAPEDYSTFYMRFIGAFEELTGLKRFRHKEAV